MSLRSWVFIVAFGVGLSTQALGQDSVILEHGQHQNQKEIEPNEETIPDSPQVLTEATSAEPSSEEHTHNKSTEGVADPGEPLGQGKPWITLSDTAAQWVMAISGVAAISISVWAVLLLKSTLNATRDTLHEAEKTTKAAEETIAVTQRVANAQLRAYVGITEGSMDLGGRNPIARFTVKNTGQTPAYGVTNWINGHAGETNEFGPPEGDDYVPRLDLMPGGDTKISFPFDDPVSVVAADRLGIPLYVWGRLEYKDAFGGLRWTRFRYRSGVGGPTERSTVKATPEGNESN